MLYADNSEAFEWAEKTLVSNPDNERTVLRHLTRDTLVTGFFVTQDKTNYRDILF